MRKLQKIAFILFVTVSVFLSSGIVSALNSEDASAEVSFSSIDMQPGQNLGLRIVFNVASPQQVQILFIGIHFDWMNETVFAGPNFSSNPQPVSSDGTYISDPIFVQIPLTVGVGSHTYYVGVDGTDASGDFSWNSTQQTIQITYSAGQTTPTPTANPDGDGQAEGTFDLKTILIVVAVVAIVIAVAVIVMEVRKKPKQVNPVAEKANPVTDQPQKDNYDI